MNMLKSLYIYEEI